jgi:hypothetical protein
VIIHNFNIEGAIFFPAKTNPPLPIDPDAVLPCPIAGQQLQSIAPQVRQIMQTLCVIQVGQSARGLIREAFKGANPSTFKKSIGVPVPKASNH